jgi:baculoviral IAP repeat-containing protein 6
MIEPLYEIYIINSTKSDKEQIKIDTIDTNDKNDKNDKNVNNIDSYNNVMKPLRFDTGNIINSNYKSSYLNALKSTKTSTQCMKRLSTEIPTLASELPIHPDASIFLRVDESNPRAMRALITGPPDTPYDSGIFIFDIYLPPNYPTEVPMINFTNTGNKRFNPNLYNCGKVCLSILGTYVGPTASQTEKWNTSSTLYQVLISIQGQILVDQPYFNEPGHQSSYKTPLGNKASEEYNHNIRLFTMQHAMLDLIDSIDNNSYPEFKSIIDNHFKLKKNKIIDICTKWIEKSKHNSNYVKVGEEIINKLTNYN